jgi:hypothetical protein
MILVGSKGRPAMPITRWLPDEYITALVEPQEVDAYRAAHPTMRLVVLDRNDGGFGYMLNSMVRYALAEGIHHYLFADDDVTGLVARPAMGEKFKRVHGPEAASILHRHVGLARDNRLAQLAISFAGHSWGSRRPTDDVVGAWGMFAADARAIAAVGYYDETLPVFNDWDVSARLLLAGHRTARTNLVSFQHKMKSMPGGIEAVYKRTELIESAALRMQDRYGPQAVRVMHHAGHGLVEPRFNWKKLGKRKESHESRSVVA